MPKLLPHIGFLARRRPMLPALATLAILLVAEGLCVSIFHPASTTLHEGAILQQLNGQAIPVPLSDSDIHFYREAFREQQAGHVEAADAALAKASDPLLKGVFLGERYLAPGSDPNFSEIALWMARYGDHAQAAELYRIARVRAPGDADFLVEPQFSATLKGFSNGHYKSMLAGKKRWISGLAAFRRHDMNSAAAQFEALLNAEGNSLSSDDRAAVAFWAARAEFSTGDKANAARYLSLAAEESRGFYSILARQMVGSRTGALVSTQAVADNDSFLQKQAVQRAIALKVIGQDALAEKELRALFPASNAYDRRHLVELARALNLPAAQMRMASAGAYGTTKGEDLYPLPRWTPTAGYRVEPALLFAIMRQESGFNPEAKSASGATGVMQLMPATAHAMAVDARLKLSHEPAVSMTLGQHYLERLMDTAAIGDNLVYLTAAYNAGPGSVIGWQKNLHAIDDPLLFIESIPCAQTRDYVVHVMGNYWVYSEILGGDDNVTAEALAQGRWPHYGHSEKQMALMVSRLGWAGAE